MLLLVIYNFNLNCLSFVCLNSHFIITGSFDYSPKFIDLNQGDSSDLSSDQGETKILEDLAEAMNENLLINKSGKIYYKLNSYLEFVIGIFLNGYFYLVVLVAKTKIYIFLIEH